MSSSKPGSTNGKVAGTEADRDVPLEYLPKKHFHEVDEMRHADVAVHHHSLHLVEGVLVGGVGGLVAEDAPGADYPEGRLVRFPCRAPGWPRYACAGGSRPRSRRCPACRGPGGTMVCSAPRSCSTRSPTSGPSRTVNPMEVKMSSISYCIRENGMEVPPRGRRGRAGSAQAHVQPLLVKKPRKLWIAGGTFFLIRSPLRFSALFRWIASPFCRVLPGPVLPRPRRIPVSSPFASQELYPYFLELVGSRTMFPWRKGRPLRFVSVFLPWA